MERPGLWELTTGTLQWYQRAHFGLFNNRRLSIRCCKVFERSKPKTKSRGRVRKSSPTDKTIDSFRKHPRCHRGSERGWTPGQSKFNKFLSFLAMIRHEFMHHSYSLRVVDEKHYQLQSSVWATRKKLLFKTLRWTTHPVLTRNIGPW